MFLNYSYGVIVSHELLKMLFDDIARTKHKVLLDTRSTINHLIVNYPDKTQHNQTDKSSDQIIFS
jgi:hypothetical protein